MRHRPRMDARPALPLAHRNHSPVFAASAIRHEKLQAAALAVVPIPSQVDVECNTRSVSVP